MSTKEAPKGGQSPVLKFTATSQAAAAGGAAGSEKKENVGVHKVKLITRDINDFPKEAQTVESKAAGKGSDESAACACEYAPTAKK